MFSNKEYQDAVQEYHAALDAINYADPEFFETANARITAAKARLGALHLSMKEDMNSVD